MTSPPRLSVVCFTNDPPHRVAASLGLLRDVAAEIVVAVDDRVDPDTLGPLTNVCDRVVRAEFVRPLEANLQWLHDQATADWVLRLDGDDVVSRALVERLATPGWERGVTHAYVSYRWLWGGPDRMLAQPPWWPDPALRLIRNVEGIARFPHGAHRPPEVAGDARFLDDAVYHLDLLLADEADRELKADGYERDAAGHRTDPGWSVNTTYYLPERLDPAPHTEALPAVDAEAVRGVLASVSPPTGPADSAGAPGAPGGGPLPHVRAADRLPPPPVEGDAALRAIATPPLAVVRGRTYTLSVGVTNRSAAVWRPDGPNAPLLHGEVRTPDGAQVGDDHWVPLPGPVAPGDEVLVRLPVHGWGDLGPATLRVGLLQQGTGWHDATLDVPVEVQYGRRVLLSTGVSPTPHLGDDLITHAVLAAVTRALPDVVPVLLAHPAGDLADRFGCQVVPSPVSGRPTRPAPAAARGRADHDDWASDLVADARRVAAGLPPLDPANGPLLTPFFDASALVVAPGGGLSSVHGDQAVVPTALEVQVAEACGLPVLVEGAYVGPLERRRDRLGVLRMARAAGRFTVRDPGSAEALRTLGASERPAPVVPDPATAMVGLARRTASRDAAAALARLGIEPGRPYVVFSLRGGHDGPAEVDLLRAVTGHIPDGAAAVYLPHTRGTDHEDLAVVAHDAWAGGHLGVLGPEVDAHTAVAIVAGAALTAGSRFHLAVLARAAGVPAVAFVDDAYDATRLESLVLDGGLQVVGYGDADGAAEATRRALAHGRTGPGPVWDGGAFAAALAAVLPPAPRLA